MKLFLARLGAYLIGSIPTGYLFAKSKKHIDLRRHGSGNVGATNVLRTVGKLPALLTLLIDIFKGFSVVTILANMTYNLDMPLTHIQYLAILGLTVVLGHILSIFMQFKGGKGVATGAGVLLALCPKLLIIGLCAWAVVFGFSKLVSLASLIAAVTIPVASYFFEYPDEIRFLMVILAIVIMISHRSNIGKLLNKKERKFSVKS